MQKLSKFLGFFISLVFFTVNALAAAPSEELLERLLKVMQVEKQVNSSIQEMEKIMTNMVLQSANYQNMPENRQKMTEAMSQKMLPIVKEEMGWGKSKQIYPSIYRVSFTQAELDSLIGLFQSPAG